MANVFMMREHGTYSTLTPIAHPDRTVDAQWHFVNPANGVEGLKNVRLQLLAYSPLAMVVALVVATPLPWKRRWQALFAGLALTCFFIMVRLWIQEAYEFSRPPFAEPGYSGLPPRMLKPFSDGAFESRTTSFVAPVIIWILVTFRMHDLRTLMAGTSADPTAPD